jgi:hypothetical protein
MTAALRGVAADGDPEYVMDDAMVEDGCVRRTGGAMERVAANVAPNRGAGRREEERRRVDSLTKGARMTSLVYSSQQMKSYIKSLKGP